MARCLSLVVALLSVAPQLLAADASSSVHYLQLQRQYRELGSKLSDRDQLTALEGMVAIYDKDGVVWHQLAQVRLRNKKYDEAIFAYRRALELGGFTNKFEAGCHYDIACALALKGESEPAFLALKKAMDLGFRDLDHLRRDSDLESLHSDARWEDIAATKDVSRMSRAEAWRYDIALLDREVRRIHYDPYRHFPSEEMDAFVARLTNDVPHLTDEQINVEIARYMARLGDGHSTISNGGRSGGQIKTLPIQLFWFEEGIFVTAAGPGAQQVTGMEVVEVAGRPVADLISLIDPLVARENEQVLKVKGPAYMTVAEVIYGLGLVKKGEDVPVTFRSSDGSLTTKLIHPSEGGPNPEWSTARDMVSPNQPLYMKDKQKAYWFDYLPDLKAVYFQYNSVRNQGQENIEAFAERMFKFIENNEVNRLIVDVRWNGGGNSFLNRPLVNGIIGCKKVQHKDGLFIITGRNTFSAAQNFTTDLDRALDPIFVGEPTGSSPNFVGETIFLTLPYSKTRVSISDLYWQRSWPMDDRKWIAPELPAPPTFELFRANRDPAMEAIEAYLKTLGGARD